MGPARALEEVVVELPLVDSTMTVRLSELRSPEALLEGNSQLAELDRASEGRVGKALVALLNHRLPLAVTKAASASVGSPLLEQGLLFVSSFGTVEGRTPDLSGETLEQTLRRAMAAAPDGQPTLLQVMKAIRVSGPASTSAGLASCCNGCCNSVCRPITCWRACPLPLWRRPAPKAPPPSQACSPCRAAQPCCRCGIAPNP